MRCKDITDIIEAAYPKEAALSFDNVGLQAGSAEQEVRKIYLAVDATHQVIEAAARSGADLLITHHPLIFFPLKKVTDEDFVSRRILELIRKGMCYYAMHTNYDVLGMGKLAAQILELSDTEALDVTMEYQDREEGIGKVGAACRPMTLEECCSFVKDRLHLPQVKVFGDPDLPIKRIAICPGSGKSVIGRALEKEADVLVTGDIGHHEGLDALEQGLAVIDAGHYGTEYIFQEDMKNFLKKNLPEIQVETAPVEIPFRIV